MSPQRTRDDMLAECWRNMLSEVLGTRFHCDTAMLGSHSVAFLAKYYVVCSLACQKGGELVGLLMIMPLQIPAEWLSKLQVAYNGKLTSSCSSLIDSCYTALLHQFVLSKPFSILSDTCQQDSDKGFGLNFTASVDCLQ